MKQATLRKGMRVITNVPMEITTGKPIPANSIGTVVSVMSNGAGVKVGRTTGYYYAHELSRP
jgi:hypothetical protein